MTYYDKNYFLSSPTGFDGTFTELNGELAYIVPPGKQGNVNIKIQYRTYEGGIITDIDGTELPIFTDTISVAGTPAVPLSPGAGWSGATPETGTGEKAIARWTTPPLQVIEDSMSVGVAAFHMNEIEKVEIAADGGDWVTIADPTLNSDSGVYEYHISVDVSNFSTSYGPTELRARVTPNSGIQRVLSLPMVVGTRADLQNVDKPGQYTTVYVDSVNGNNSNAGTEAAPWQTLTKAVRGGSFGGSFSGDSSGRIVYLKAGEYPYEDTQNSNYGINPDAWITIMPAPGASRSEVRVVKPSGGSPRMDVQNIHWKNIDFVGAANSPYFDGTIDGSSKASQDPCAIYLENCTIGTSDNNVSRYIFNTNTNFEGGSFCTDVTATAYSKPFIGLTLARSCTAENVSEDTFTNTKAVINCILELSQLPSGNTGHPDVYQVVNSGVTPERTVTTENNIVYGLQCYQTNAPILFTSNLDLLKDCAFVNIYSETLGYVSQFRDCNLQHILILNYHQNLDAGNVATDGNNFLIEELEGNKSGVGFYVNYNNVRVENCSFWVSYIIEGDYPSGHLDPTGNSNAGDPIDIVTDNCSNAKPGTSGFSNVEYTSRGWTDAFEDTAAGSKNVPCDIFNRPRSTTGTADRGAFEGDPAGLFPISTSLIPGSETPGSWAVTSGDSEQVGSASAHGADMKAIGHWVEPGWENFGSGETKTLELAADHLYGIEKVTFVANDGTAVDVTTTNASGHYEIDVTMGSDDIEVRATIVPNTAGLKTVMQGAIDPTIYLSDTSLGGYNENPSRLYGNDIRSYMMFTGAPTEHFVSNMADLNDALLDAVAQGAGTGHRFLLDDGDYDTTAGVLPSQSNQTHTRWWTIKGTSTAGTRFLQTQSVVGKLAAVNQLMKVDSCTFVQTDHLYKTSKGNTNQTFTDAGSGVWTSGVITTKNNLLNAYTGWKQCDIDTVNREVTITLEEFDAVDRYNANDPEKAYDLWNTAGNCTGVTFTWLTGSFDVSDATKTGTNAGTRTFVYDLTESQVNDFLAIPTDDGEKLFTNITIDDVIVPQNLDFWAQGNTTSCKTFMVNIAYTGTTVWKTAAETGGVEQGLGSYPQPLPSFYAVTGETPYVTANSRAKWSVDNTYTNAALTVGENGSASGKMAIVTRSRYDNNAGDVYSNASLVSDCSIDNLNGAGSSFHSDVWQLYSNAPFDEVSQLMVNKLTAYFENDGSAQGIFCSGVDGSPIKDVVIRDCKLRNQVGSFKWGTKSDQDPLQISNLCVIDSELYSGGNVFENGETTTGTKGSTFSVNSFSEPGETFANNPFVFGNGITSVKESPASNTAGPDPLVYWQNESGNPNSTPGDPGTLVPYWGPDNHFVVASVSDLAGVTQRDGISDPVFNDAPSITSQPTEGVLITIADNTPTSPSHTIASQTYQWYRDDVAISGATSATYTPVALDIGTILSVLLTVTNDDTPIAGVATALASAEFPVQSAVSQSVFYSFSTSHPGYIAELADAAAVVSSYPDTQTNIQNDAPLTDVCVFSSADDCYETHGIEAVAFFSSYFLVTFRATLSTSLATNRTNFMNAITADGWITDSTDAGYSETTSTASVVLTRGSASARVGGSMSNDPRDSWLNTLAAGETISLLAPTPSNPSADLTISGTTDVVAGTGASTDSTGIVSVPDVSGLNAVTIRGEFNSSSRIFFTFDTESERDAFAATYANGSSAQLDIGNETYTNASLTWNNFGTSSGEFSLLASTQFDDWPDEVPVGTSYSFSITLL